MDKLRFGTAGRPTITKGNTEDGIRDVRKLKLDAFELEFVRSINITKEKAPLVNKVSKENDIILSNHAPYFLNLNSQNPKTFHASISYIINSAKITSLCGGWSVCFHAAYYMKDPAEKAYERVKEAIKKIVNEIKEFDNRIWIRPEISGRKSQFGDLKEVINLSKEIDQVMPCVDFAHMHARSGKYNTYKEFSSILEEIEKYLGKEALQNMHIHVAGIEYGEKGEKNHLNLQDSDLNYKELVKAWKDFKIKGVVISESPNIEKDALLLQKEYMK